MFIIIHLFVRDSDILFYISLKTLVYNSLQAHPLETDDDVKTAVYKPV